MKKDEELIVLLKREKNGVRKEIINEKLFDELYMRYRPFLFSKAKKVSEKYRINYEDAFSGMNYLFEFALDKFDGRGSFKGFMEYYFECKIKAHLNGESLPGAKKSFKMFDFGIETFDDSILYE